MTPARIEPATFRLVAQCLNQLCHCLPQVEVLGQKLIIFLTLVPCTAHARSLRLSYQCNLKEYHGYLHKLKALLCVMPTLCGTMKIIGLQQGNRAKTAMWPACAYLACTKSILRSLCSSFCSISRIKTDVPKLFDISDFQRR
jgi:hypothetical protein